MVLRFIHLAEVRLPLTEMLSHIVPIRADWISNSIEVDTAILAASLPCLRP